MDLIRKYTPTREEMAANKYLAPIAHRFLSPELWRFTRRSVPRGVALGLFAAFIIPVGQIFLAAFLALPSRANVPLATVVTFVTNPFTLPFWLVVANRVGTFTLRIDAAGPALANAHVESSTWAMVADFFQMAGRPRSALRSWRLSRLPSGISCPDGSGALWCPADAPNG